jgi:hypothetical protein
VSKVPDGRCTPESLPAGARHISAARDGDLTCRDGIAAVESAEAEAEAEAKAEAEGKAELKLNGGPSSVDDIGRLEPVWTGGTLDPQCSKEKENRGEYAS